MSRSPRLVIAGDRTIDWYFYPRPAADTGLNWQLKPSLQTICLPGGVLLLKELVQAALESYDLSPVISATPAPKGELRKVSPQEAVHSNATLGCVKTGEKKTTWLVSQAEGFIGPNPGAAAIAPSPEPPVEQPDLIIVDDHGNGFRNEMASWPKALKNWDGETPLIYKMRHPMDKRRHRDRLWERLEQQLQSPQANFTLVISADDLRATEGIKISQGLSWERTAKDFLFQMKFAEALQPLRACPCLVVLFGWEGAIVYRNPSNSPDPVATLHFDSERIEGGFYSSVPGTMFGMTSVFLAALSAAVVHRRLEDEHPRPKRRYASASLPRHLGDMIDGYLPESLARARLWLQTGFGSDSDPAGKYPLAKVFPAPEPDAKHQNPQRKALPDDFSWTTILPVSSSTDSDPTPWRIVHQEWPSISAVIAKENVRTGKAPGLMRSPTGVFGKLRTVDRTEIESYNAIRVLVREFLEAKSRKRPLCIGVFGPPGAGKSFGVEEVIKSIAGEGVEGLTFNISQFKSDEDLVAACHRVRDKVLVGKTPFVFFDEFDSAGLDGSELGWLRSFLALMQDGSFRDGEEMHPLGKCILVFAGGTASTFHEFEEMAAQAPKALKGRDFVSRLRGYVNVRGPNPSGDDPAYVLRRALILRSMLERNKDAQGLFNTQRELQIDEGVLRALLLVTEYRHGTRSMEAILDMSQLAGKSRFDQYSLPPTDQLAVHVPADEFVELTRSITQDATEIDRLKQWLGMIGYGLRPIPPYRNEPWGGNGDRPQTPLICDPAQWRTLAEQTHRGWCQVMCDQHVKAGSEEIPGKSNPYLQSFSTLPLAVLRLIDHRIAQIPVILRDAGLEIIHPDEPEDWTFEDGLLDKLARIQHGSYEGQTDAETKARRAAGFLAKYNSNAIPFDELPLAKQESNRDYVRTIPRKLFWVGLEAVEIKLSTAKATLPMKPTPKSIELLTKVRERLAELEHSRWNWQSLLQGYVYKPGLKNDDRRTNPLIIPWLDLPDDMRQRDLPDPKLLAGLILAAGYEVKPAAIRKSP